MPAIRLLLFPVLLIFLIFIVSCGSNAPKSPDRNQEVDENPVAEPSKDQSEDSEEDTSELEYGNKVGMMEQVIMHASNHPWSMLQGGFITSTTYESLIESGALAIIFSNSYTGEDIISTREYSPGDIYLGFPTLEDPVYRYWLHLGENDMYYNPDISEPGEREPLEFNPEYSTDGRIFYREYVLDAEAIEYIKQEVTPAAGRREQGIPADDIARARVFNIYWTMEDIIRSIGYDMPDPPETLDGYIALLGRKNPISWINLYTNEPMIEVPWVNVPFYVRGNNIPDESPWPQDKIDKEPLAGNYSFVLGNSPYYPNEQGERTACAQFYFYLPSGDIAAYQIMGPQRR